MIYLNDFGSISLFVGDIVDLVDGSVIIDKLVRSFHGKPTNVAEAADLLALGAVRCFNSKNYY